MLSTKEILKKISIMYKGVELNRITALKRYGEFLCDVIDSQEKHTAAIALHTGSENYQAIAIAVSVLGCLFYQNTDIIDLLVSLKAGDKLIINGKRVRFVGIQSGDQLGMSADDIYFGYEFDNSGGKKYLRIEDTSKLSISLYQGETDDLSGRGIKATLKLRKKFLSAFFEDDKKSEITTEISHSVAVIIDRNKAERFYRGISFVFGNNKVTLADLVTASYYSEDECYQIGNNPTKEEPILKFFSKVSVCRDVIMDDKRKRIIGCLVGDENLWSANSEIHDIADRKGLKFVVMAGKTHYTRFIDWYEMDYKFYAYVPELVQNIIDEPEPLQGAHIFEQEIKSFAKHNIVNKGIQCNVKQNVVYEIKKKLLKIKNECIDEGTKENFLMESYFLLNLCRSAFFPLSYCDKAHEQKLLGWTICEKISSINSFVLSLKGELKEDAKFISDNIAQMVFELYDYNPKGEIVKSQLEMGNVDCIVVTKTYYDAVLSLWLDDLKFRVNPVILTVSSFEKSVGIYKNVIFTTAYYDFSFNPYASFGYVAAEVLLYSYEMSQDRRLKRNAEKGRLLLRDKNAIAYNISEEYDRIESIKEYEDDGRFESEMDKLAKSLLLKGAYRYISTTENTGEAVTKIEKIFTFASGCVGYFTKYFKGYRIQGENVIETDLDELRVGDSIVFTKQNENKDIVDVLMNQLLKDRLKNTQFPEYYRLSTCWKIELRKYMEGNDLTYKQLADRLAQLGCFKHQATIRSWLIDESYIVGPRDLNDYAAIIKLINLKESPTAIKNGCDEIRSLRIKILDLLGKAIIQGMFTDEKNAITDMIYKKIENLVRIEQITSITNSDINARVPIYILNKPYNI